jgi:antitoxin (DNA-binding transcriptional repressor) of toxin-antitoxin stability system
MPLARLRQSILKHAFEGHLVPQDPTDEPASVLLEPMRSIRSVHEGNGLAATPNQTRGKITPASDEPRTSTRRSSSNQTHQEDCRMTTVTIEEAQAKLPELIEHLAAGEELVITRNQQPIARLLAEAKPERKPRRAGSAKGMLSILADDDDHLQDFAEYME